MIKHSDDNGIVDEDPPARAAGPDGLREALAEGVREGRRHTLYYEEIKLSHNRGM